MEVFAFNEMKCSRPTREQHFCWHKSANITQSIAENDGQNLSFDGLDVGREQCHTFLSSVDNQWSLFTLEQAVCTVQFPVS